MKRLFAIAFLTAILISCSEDQTWKERIDGLEGLNTIKEESSKYWSDLNSKEEIIMAGRDTAVAPFYYSIILYPPLSERDLKRLEDKYDLEIPDSYESILTQINGAFVGHISLYGFPGAYVQSGLINRTELEPLNILTANDTWIYDVGLGNEDFLFGSSSFNDSTNIYYSIRGKNVVGYLSTGEKVKEWISVDQILGEEVMRLKSR
jgi:hypothetical protein